MDTNYSYLITTCDVIKIAYINNNLREHGIYNRTTEPHVRILWLPNNYSYISLIIFVLHLGF